MWNEIFRQEGVLPTESKANAFALPKEIWDKMRGKKVTVSVFSHLSTGEGKVNVSFETEAPKKKKYKKYPH